MNEWIDDVKDSFIWHSIDDLRAYRRNVKADLDLENEDKNRYNLDARIKLIDALRQVDERIVTLESHADLLEGAIVYHGYSYWMIDYAPDLKMAWEAIIHADVSGSVGAHLTESELRDGGIVPKREASVHRLTDLHFVRAGVYGQPPFEHGDWNEDRDRKTPAKIEAKDYQHVEIRAAQK